ncbi:MAG: crotonase/enoyl-CoA hydratase family protein [Gemmobacter sp.]
MEPTVKVTVDGQGIARMILSRADKHNALDAGMMDALTQAAGTLGANPEVRAVILCAEGPTFCAGGDLAWMRAQVQADGSTRAREARRLAGMLGALNTLPKPLIGCVQGNAFGGGVGLMAVCDTVVVADHATFGLTETKLGLIPATIGPYVVARMGEARARSVFFSARLFGADEAVRLGLATRAVPAGDLAAAVEAEAMPYLTCAPGAVAEGKALIAALSRPVTPEMVETSIAALVARWEHPEAAEGIAAFLARRKPHWAR